MKIPSVESEEELLNWHIGLYYQAVEKNPDVRTNLDLGIKTIAHIDRLFRIQIKKNKKFDHQKYQDAFSDAMEFLTRVAEKKKLQEKLSADKEAFRNKHKKQTQQ